MQLAFQFWLLIELPILLKRLAERYCSTSFENTFVVYLHPFRFVGKVSNVIFVSIVVLTTGALGERKLPQFVYATVVLLMGDTVHLLFL